MAIVDAGALRGTESPGREGFHSQPRPEILQLARLTSSWIDPGKVQASPDDWIHVKLEGLVVSLHRGVVSRRDHDVAARGFTF